MPGVKRLRSVAYSLAQHCLSGLCQFAPERTLAEQRAGLAKISVALIDPTQSDSSLRTRLTDILAKEHIDVSVLASAQADFLFVGQCRTANQCVVTLVLTNGK